MVAKHKAHTHIHRLAHTKKKAMQPPKALSYCRSIRHKYSIESIHTKKSTIRPIDVIVHT
jgi:hypothetical protein